MANKRDGFGAVLTIGGVDFDVISLTPFGFDAQEPIEIWHSGKSNIIENYEGRLQNNTFECHSYV